MLLLKYYYFIIVIIIEHLWSGVLCNFGRFCLSLCLYVCLSVRQ